MPGRFLDASPATSMSDGDARLADADTRLHYIRCALDEARKCLPIPTAFCVGCVLVVRLDDTDSVGRVLATGFSRELPGNTHAEANALAKARALTSAQLADIFPDVPAENLHLDRLLERADVYTTLEPCSVRTSGLAPCADALVNAKVRACYIGVGEPDDFVNCEGAAKLRDAGIAVIWLDGLQKECLEVARTGHGT